VHLFPPLSVDGSSSPPFFLGKHDLSLKPRSAPFLGKISFSFRVRASYSFHRSFSEYNGTGVSLALIPLTPRRSSSSFWSRGLSLFLKYFTEPLLLFPLSPRGRSPLPPPFKARGTTFFFIFADSPRNLALLHPCTEQNETLLLDWGFFGGGGGGLLGFWGVGFGLSSYVREHPLLFCQDDGEDPSLFLFVSSGFPPPYILLKIVVCFFLLFFHRKAPHSGEFFSPVSLPFPIICAS